MAESVPKMVSSWNSDSVSILVPFFFIASKKSNIAGREHLVMRRGAEIVFQAAAMQARRGIVGRDERDLVALADLADGDGDRALIGADDGADLLLGDQALGLGAALLRIGLVVGEHEADLGAAEARQALALRQRQIEIVVRC